MAPFRFKALPLDIQTSIVDQINLPSCLKSLCLVSKALHQLCIPRLYSRFIVDLHNQQTPWLTALLNRENPGIPHIRHLLVKDNNYEKDRKNKSRLIHATLALLHPNTLLTYGNVDPDIYLDVSIEPFLALQQRLKSIGFLNLHDFVPPLDRLITMLGSMERVQSLSIRVPYLPGLPYNKTKAQNGRKILHVLKGIEKLKFSQKDQSKKARSAITEDRESGSKGDDFARLLFRNIYVGQISPRSTLRELELCSVRMKLGVGWLDVIHWSQLKVLKLKECSRVSDLLHGLADQIFLSGCALQDFEFFDDYNSSTDDSSTDDSPTGDSALESFLLSFSGLRRLVLRVDKSPQAGCISQHKETLDTLEISSRGYPYQPSPADIKKICETCLELRRLALPADPRALRAPSTPVFPMTEKTSSNGFCAVLDAISKLPRLRTLCFPNDPPTLGEYQHCSEDWESGEQDPEEYELYRKVLAQDLAERIFKRFALRAEKAQRQSTITMLGFSSCGGTGSDDTLYYTKGLISIRSAVSLASHKSVTAIATRPRLNRYLDSEVDEIDCIWD